MRREIAIVAVLSLSVLPAQSAGPESDEIFLLTPIDSLPTRNQIVSVAPDPIARLSELSLSTTADFGMSLRAIRALPQFCVGTGPTCQEDSDSQMHPVRTAVRDVIASISPGDRSGKSLLRLRAAIEALGAIQSGEQSDVDLLIPLLDHTSRDIRFATARALRELCMPSAEAALRNRYEDETVPQVRLAISAALGDLEQCSQ